MNSGRILRRAGSLGLAACAAFEREGYSRAEKLTKEP